jgi:hypothetical protein
MQHWNYRMQSAKQILEQNKALIKNLGAELPFELKQRDDREPGKERKEAQENKLFRLLRRYWKEQKQAIEERFRWSLPLKADVLGNRFWDDEDARLLAELTKLFTNAATDGIALFGELENIGLDYSLSNAEAAEWAKQYSFELIKGINSTTREAVNKAVQNYIDIPGFTLGDLLQQLPYSEKRALNIAVTEVTRAYAEGNRLAGEQLRNEFPNVRVIKIWFTNADDRVCPICSPLDGKQVPIEKQFTNGIDNPPAHIGCRCWTTTSTELRK